MDGVQVNRAHVIELGSKVADQLVEIWRGKLRRARRRRRFALHFVITLQLRSQSFFKRSLICIKFAQVNLISA